VFFREWVEVGVSRAACSSGESAVGRSALGLSIAPGALVPLAGDLRLHRPDRDQHQRLGLRVHRQQPLHELQCPAQVFDAALLPAHGPGLSGTEVNLHGRFSEKFEHCRMWA